MNQIAAIIVTYNRKELLVQCIEKIKRQKGAVCDILIIDNASTDGTKDYMDAYQSGESVFYYNTGENVGGAGGFCFGLRMAALRGYRYFWIMDDDTFPEEGALQALLQADEELQGEYGFLSSAVLWKDGYFCKMNRQKITKNAYEKVHLLEKGLLPVYQATFVSFFLKRETVLKMGLPIKEFFIWGDDVEYTHRLSKVKDCYLVGRSKVIHYTANNVGSSIAEDESSRLDRYRYAYRNENYIARHEGIYGRIYYLMKCGLNIGRILFNSKEHKMKRIWIILSSMVAGIFFNPPIEYVSKSEGIEEYGESA